MHTAAQPLEPSGADCTIAYGRLRRHGSHSFRLTVASGGHPLPLVLRQSGRVEALGAYGTIVGCLAEVQFTDASTRLNPGDAVVFVTDGVTEARVGTQLFGSDGLVETLGGCSGQTASQIAETVDLAACSGGCQRDDVAIVVLKVDDQGLR